MRFLIFILGLCFSISSFAETQFVLTTKTFPEAGIMPTLYTCDGKDISPEFAWKQPPEKTHAFAFVVSDPDAPSGVWYHWVVYNIPLSAKELPENVTRLPKGAIAGKNSWGNTRYNGPCPPKGAAHTYIFTLYALDAPLKISDNADVKDVLTQINSHTLNKTQVTAVYSRWNK